MRAYKIGDALFSSVKSAVSTCGFHLGNPLFPKPFRF